jgi:hypothetical protein
MQNACADERSSEKISGFLVLQMRNGAKRLNIRAWIPVV